MNTGLMLLVVGLMSEKEGTAFTALKLDLDPPLLLHLQERLDAKPEPDFKLNSYFELARVSHPFVETTPDGKPLTYATAKDITDAMSEHYSKHGSPQRAANNAAWHYMGALPPHYPIALWWH